MGFLSVKKQGVDSFQALLVCCTITDRYEYWMKKLSFQRCIWRLKMLCSWDVYLNYGYFFLKLF